MKRAANTWASFFVSLTVVGSSWFVSVVTASAEAPTSDLVFVQKGELPILISAPHGGNKKIDGVKARDTSSSALREENTQQMAEKLNTALERVMSRKPYVVIALFERKYIDANRSEDEAYDSPEAEKHYRAYHGAMAEACREIGDRWHGGLLLDLHGQASSTDDVLRGTNNGQTVKLLVERHGKEAFIGPSGVCGRLATSGYELKPAIDSDDRENPKATGGYIVRTYGSHQPGGIDAIQLEFGRKYRVPLEATGKTADDLAEATAGFIRIYMPDALK